MKNTLLLLLAFLFFSICNSQENCNYENYNYLREFYSIEDINQQIAIKSRILEEKIKSGELSKKDSTKYIKKLKERILVFDTIPDNKSASKLMRKFLDSGDEKIYNKIVSKDLNNFILCLETNKINGNPKKKKLNSLQNKTVHKFSSSFKTDTGQFIVVHFCNGSGYLNGYSEILIYEIKNQELVINDNIIIYKS